jgi:2-isopropylmalate synthase
VRVLTPQDGTAATVRVLIEHGNGTETWNTVGVSANILDASWQALADGLRYFLLHSAPEESSSAETATVQATPAE